MATEPTWKETMARDQVEGGRRGATTYWLMSFQLISVTKLKIQRGGVSALNADGREGEATGVSHRLMSSNVHLSYNSLSPVSHLSYVSVSIFTHINLITL